MMVPPQAKYQLLPERPSNRAIQGYWLTKAFVPPTTPTPPSSWLLYLLRPQVPLALGVVDEDEDDDDDDDVDDDGVEDVDEEAEVEADVDVADEEEDEADDEVEAEVDDEEEAGEEL